MTTERGRAAERWDAGERYEPYVGRWSRRVAPAFLAWLDVPPGADWLDVGCGTGALTQAVTVLAFPRSVVGVDPSAGFLDHARRQVADDRVDFRRGDATSLPLADASVGCVVSGLVLNFVPDVAAALAEMVRVAGKGATVAAYVWDYAGRMQLIRCFWDAAVALDPAAGPLDEGVRFPLCTPDALTSAFTGAGLADVAVRGIEVPTVFTDFDDYWTPFLGGQGPAPSYCASLPDEHRDRLRARLRDTLPVVSDGSIPLVARAWAVRGRVRGDRPAGPGG